MNRLPKWSTTQLLALTLLSAVTFLSCGGQNIGQAIDDLQGKIVSTGGLLGHTTGLAEAQALDILQIRLQELRAQWKDSLNDSINTLDVEQARTLNNVSQGIEQVHGVLDHTTKMEDLAVLDATVIMSKFGISGNDEVRRVVPSAQIHKHLGYYHYEVTMPLFGTGNKIKGISINGIPVLEYKSDLPPHGFRLDVPADKLEAKFDDWKLGRATLLIDLEVPNKKWWKPWASPIKETVRVDTGLFPRYPLRYWFAQHPHHTEVDKDDAHIQVINSPQTLIPGCGNSGCYWSYNVCAIAPVNSQQVGDAFDPHDSFNGWGAFIGSPSASGNITCWTYQQHSHNQARNVWFSSHYRPPIDVTETHYFTLMPLDVPAVTSERNIRPRLIPVVLGGVPTIRAQGGIFGEVARQLQEQAKQVAQLPSQLQILGIGKINASSDTPPPNGSPVPVQNLAYTAPNGDTGPTPRPLEYGMSYFGPYHIGTNWELVVQAFTGETIAVTTTGGGGATHQVQATPQTDRLVIETHTPY